MKAKKFIIIGIIAVLALGTVAYGMMRPRTVPAVLVESKDIRLFFTEEGFVKDENLINVFTLHTGEILSLSVQENQWINKGDVICVIDNAQLLYELETAKSSIRGIESQISDLHLREMQMKDELTVSRNKLRGDYETLTAEEKNASQSLLNTTVTRDEQIKLQEIIIGQNRIDLKNAQDDLRVSELLFNSGVLSKLELDNQQTTVDHLESIVSQNLQQLEIIKNSNDFLSKDSYFQSMKRTLQAQISGIDKQLNHSYNQAMNEFYLTQIEGTESRIRLLEKQIDDCIVRAPVSGQITQLNVDKSNVASMDTPVAVISTGFDNQIEVFVPTSEIANVKLNDIVELELKSDANTVYQGVVTEIEDRAVVIVSSLGIERRKVKVTIQPDPEHAGHFKAGFDLSTRFITYSESNRITVPRTSVVRSDNSTSVWVIANGKAELRPIEIERELKVEYVIKSGLAEEEIIVRDASAAGLAEGVSLVGNI